MNATHVVPSSHGFLQDEEDPRDRLTQRLLQAARRRMARLRAAPVLRPPLGVRVAILMGGARDGFWLPDAQDVLRLFGVRFEVERVDPVNAAELARAFVAREERQHLEVLIAGAVEAPLLPGLVATGTRLPVLPVPASPDAPVIAAAAARNAALCAVRILALRDPVLRMRLARFERQGTKASRFQLRGSKRQTRS